MAALMIVFSGFQMWNCNKLDEKSSGHTTVCILNIPVLLTGPLIHLGFGFPLNVHSFKPETGRNDHNLCMFRPLLETLT